MGHDPIVYNAIIICVEWILAAGIARVIFKNRTVIIPTFWFPVVVGRSDPKGQNSRIKGFLQLRRPEAWIGRYLKYVLGAWETFTYRCVHILCHCSSWECWHILSYIWSTLGCHPSVEEWDKYAMPAHKLTWTTFWKASLIGSLRMGKHRRSIGSMRNAIRLSVWCLASGVCSLFLKEMFQSQSFINGYVCNLHPQDFDYYC